MSYLLLTTNPTGKYKKGEDSFASELENNDLAQFNITAWSRLLALAKFYGWKPAGTLSPCKNWDDDWQDYSSDPYPEGWNGTYFSNDSQVVTAEDAARLADALEKALDDLPDIESPRLIAELGPGDHVPGSGIDASFINMLLEAGNSITCINPDLHPLEMLAGPEMKSAIIGFIAMCRKGAFEIW